MRAQNARHLPEHGYGLGSTQQQQSCANQTTSATNAKPTPLIPATAFGHSTAIDCPCCTWNSANESALDLLRSARAASITNPVRSRLDARPWTPLLQRWYSRPDPKRSRRRARPAQQPLPCRRWSAPVRTAQGFQGRFGRHTRGRCHSRERSSGNPWLRPVSGVPSHSFPRRACISPETRSSRA